MKRYKIKNNRIFGGAGEPILKGDILYQDELVCILSPDVKKGIIIFSEFTQPAEKDSLCNIGLKTGKQLQSEGVRFGRSVYHPHIFFRAPFYSRPIDYSIIDTEIYSSYGDIDKNSKVFIRVDPDRTFVFSSEIRVHTESISELDKSKKTLTEYLRIIKENESLEIPFNKTAYNLHSSRKEYRDSKSYPYNHYPIERNSEILIGIPHLNPCFFVTCVPSPTKISTLELLSSWKSSPSPKSFPTPIGSPPYPNMEWNTKLGKWERPIGHPPRLNSVWDPIWQKWKVPKNKKK